MTCTSQQIDLVMHQLKRHQFEALKLSSLVREGEFYYITDDKPTETVISSLLSGYYAIGSSKFTRDVSAMISSDATYVFQNETKQDLKIYKISRAQYESLKQQQLLRDDTYYYIVDDPTVEDKIEGYLSGYYLKSETSSAQQISDGILESQDKCVKLSSEVVQNLSTSLSVQGFIRVGGITVQGRKFAELATSLIPLEQQSSTRLGQAYLMISTDFQNHYIQGHTYLLTTDISGDLEYKDITDLNEMSVTYSSDKEDLSFDSHVGSVVFNEEEQDLEL